MNPYLESNEVTENPYVETDQPEITKADAVNIRNAAMAFSAATGMSELEAGRLFAPKTSDEASAEARTAITNAWLNTSADFHGNALLNPSQGGELVPFQNEVDATVIDSINYTEDPELFVQETKYPDVDEQVAASQANIHRLQNIAGNKMSDVGLMEAAWNFGELVIPFMGSTAKDSADFTNGSMLSTRDDMIRMKAQFGMLSPKDQEVLLSIIYESALEAADGNELMATMLISEFTSPLTETSNENLDKIFLGLDVGTLGLGIVNRVGRAIKAGNAVNRARKLTDRSTAANIAAVGSRSTEAARSLGLTEGEIGFSAQPYKMKGIMDDIPDDIAEELNPIMEAMDAATKVREQSLEILDRQILNERLADLGNRTTVRKAEYIPRQGTESAKMKVTIAKGNKGKPKEIVLDSLGMDEYGVFRTRPTTIIGKASQIAKQQLTSRSTMFVEDVNRIVNLPTNAKHLQARMSKIYGNIERMHKKRVRKLSAREKKEYDSLITRGADEGKEWTWVDLADYSDAVKTAYKEQRLMSEYQWYVKSWDRLNQFRLQGFDSYIHVPFKELEGNVHGIGTVVNAPQNSLSQSKVKEVYDIEAGSAIKVDELDDDFFETYKLVRLAHHVDMPDGAAYRYVIARSEHIRPLQQADVLPKLPGYVTKRHTQATYFVTAPVRGRVDGFDNQIKYSVTDQAFSTREKAEAYVKNKYGSVEMAAEDGVRIRYDREYDAIEEAGENRLYSGLYTGKRKKEGLLVDGKVDSDLAHHEDAMAEYFQNLATQGIFETTKAELKQTWLNTYKDIIPREFQTSFKNAVNYLEKGNDQTRVAIAREQHEFINILASSRTQHEVETQRMLRQWTESIPWLNNIITKWQKEGKSGHGLVKEMVFHLNLGMFNPSQLLVQGSGALLSFGAHPIAYTKALPSIMNILRSEMSELIPLPKSNMARLWQMSGMSESVNLQADAMNALSRANAASNLSATFFTYGEKINRVSAFGTAYQVIRNKAGRALTEADLPDVMNLANNLSLNFTSVNKAKWQNGWMGVITQFQQVWEKSFNQIYNPFIKSPLTAQERIGAAVVQSLVFGMAGLPLSFAFEYIDEQAAKQGWPSEMVEAVHRGLQGLIPIKNDFASRMAVGSALSNFYINTLLLGNGLQEGFVNNLKKGMLGVAGSSIARLYDGMARVNMAVKVGDAETVWRNVSEAAISNFSSTRNLYNAVWIYGQYNELRSGTGKVQWKGDLTGLEQTLLALGFTLKEVQDAYYLDDVMRQEDGWINDLASRIVQVMGPDIHRYNLTTVETYHPDYGMLGAIIPRLNLAQREKLTRLVESKLLKDESKVEQIGSKLHDEFYRMLTIKDLPEEQ